MTEEIKLFFHYKETKVRCGGSYAGWTVSRQAWTGRASDERPESDDATGGVNKTFWTRKRSTCRTDRRCRANSHNCGGWKTNHPGNTIDVLHTCIRSTWLNSKGQNPLHQFPGNKSVTSWRRQKVRCVCCVVSFPKFHYNDLLPTCYGLVSDKRRNIWTWEDSSPCG